MTNEEMMEWIRNASYAQMLAKQRFAPVGDPFFCTDNKQVCAFWDEQFKAKRAATGDNGVSASKAIGW
jgi:hypothetical protein